MDTVAKWLDQAMPNIISGLVVAFAIWLFGNVIWNFINSRKEETQRQREAQELEQEQLRDKKHHTPMRDEDFLELCMSGDAAKVEEAILNGVNINAKDNDGRTALILAANHGCIEVVEILLKHGADVNAKDKWGHTALSHVVMSNETEIARLLRSYGAK